MKQPLIIGAQSTIGAALYKKLDARGDVAGTTRRKNAAPLIALDLADDPASWPQLPECDVAFLCAAQTKLDACAKNPEYTRLINVTHMKTLADRLAKQGAYVIFLSTNQVFDGEKPFRKADEPVSPRNEYGRQKADFEKWLLDSKHNAAVLRLTKVIAHRLPILDQWQQKLSNGEVIEAFGDLSFAPLGINAVIKGMLSLAEKKQRGIYQLSGTADVSYFRIAQEWAQRLNASEVLIKESSALAAGIPMEFLPRHGTLDRATMADIDVLPPFETVLGMVGDA